MVQKIDQTPIAYSPDREWFTLAIEVTPNVATEEEATEESAERAEATQEADSQEKPDAENSDAPKDAAIAATEAQERTPPVKQTFYRTFIVFPPGDYEIGSLKDEPDRQNDEIRHAVTITRPFALLDREITFDELIAFNPQYSGFMRQFNASPEDAGFGPMWCDAVQFCHWLSEQRGDTEEVQSYPAAESLDKEKCPRESHKEANWAPPLVAQALLDALEQ